MTHIEPPDNGQTVFVVDDDAVVRVVLEEMLQTSGYRVECHASAEEFLAAWRDGGHGCALLDMVMPGMNGAELQAEMARRGIDLPIIFLSGQGDIPTTVRAMREGALDFLTKPVTLPVLIQAIDAALARDAENHRLALERRELRSRLEKLSAREREVLDLALAGLQNKEIARDLGLSHRTVEVHRSRIFLKLGVTSLMEAMRLIASIGGMPTKRSGAPGQDGTREA